MTDKPKKKTVELEFPVTVTPDGEDSTPVTYSELTLRRMKAKDALVAEDETNQARAGYLIFARLAGVPVAVIEELDMEDLAAVGEAAKTLMGKRVAAMAETSGAEAAMGAALTGVT